MIAMKATRALLMVQAVLIEDKGRVLTKLSEVFVGKISIDGKPYELLCHILNRVPMNYYYYYICIVF